MKQTISATEATASTTGAARADADLRDLWRFYARRANDLTLMACVVVSILSIAGFAIVALMHARWALRWWPLVLPPVVVGAFGAWGVADRELTERRRGAEARSLSIRVLVGVEWASCIVAALAGAAATIVFLRMTVGTWIS